MSSTETHQLAVAVMEACSAAEVDMSAFDENMDPSSSSLSSILKRGRDSPVCPWWPLGERAGARRGAEGGLHLDLGQ